MKNSKLFTKENALLLGLFAFVVLARIFPMIPNFSPLMAFAILVGKREKNWASISFVVAVLILSDLFLGFHETQAFVYLPILMITILSAKFLRRFSWSKLGAASLGSSAFFFVVSNFGVWFMSGMYEKSMAGLSQAYLAAIPFLHLSAMGDLFFCVSFFALALKFEAASPRTLPA